MMYSKIIKQMGLILVLADTSNLTTVLRLTRSNIHTYKKTRDQARPEDRTR
jgi:hypothetical protein